MKTIEELKKAGFHCRNFVMVNDQRFSFNVSTNKIVLAEESDSVINLIVSLNKIQKKGSEADIKEINEAKMVAWYPCEDSSKDTIKYLKCIILIDKENKNISETVETYCNICKDFKSVLHKH